VAAQVELAQVQGGDQLVQVGGEGVVVVSRARPAGVAEAAAIVGDDSVATRDKRSFLTFPGASVEGEPMDQHDRASRAVIFVIDIDRRRVLFAYRDVWHRRDVPFLSCFFIRVK